MKAGSSTAAPVDDSPAHIRGSSHLNHPDEQDKASECQGMERLPIVFARYFFRSKDDNEKR
jgi:hypothetical protein